MLGLGVAGLVILALFRNALALAISAGLLWAASDTSIKALSVPIIALTSAVLAFALAIVAAALAPPPSARAEALESSDRASLSG
ncbi:MAG: hypothetical protein ACXVQR_04410 [Solirubrobacteraceae bacterium]